MNCDLYLKILRGSPLSDKEAELLGTIIREVLKFMLRNNVLPTPKNYEKWFMVFCYAYEKLQRQPSDQELIDIYQSIHSDEKPNDIRLDVTVTLEFLSRIVDDFREMVREHSAYATKKEEELSKLEGEEVTPLFLELLAHIREIRAQNEKFIQKIEEQQRVIQELRAKIEQAEAEANIDHLTNAFNRRSFERALRECYEEYKKRGTPFSLVLIDLNRFKSINDQYGHAVGDLVLRRVAQVLRQNLRAKDILARWGGDEFAIIMPSTVKEQALLVAERLKKAVELIEIRVEERILKLSLSYGVAQAEEKYTNVEQILEEADKLMYQQKRAGELPEG